MKINKMKGTQDFLGKDIERYRYIEQVACRISQQFGYHEMMTPIFEATETFTRSVGEASDIVNKEMYTFMDRGKRSITLRPEGTAGIARSFVENKQYAQPGLSNWYYIGPMFRYERPQAGRTRQFTQFGVESFGDESPLLDADVINLNYQILKAIGITKLKVLVNTIGSDEARQGYINILKNHFKPHLEELCHDCQIRFEKNPLRMLDCKVDQELEVMKNAPTIKDYLIEEDQKYFQEVLKTLEDLKIPYQVSERLVRGLDYYSQTVFEIVYDDATSPLDGLALSGGGRYNGLIHEFEGPRTKAIGFAMGIERLILVMDELEIEVPESKTIKATVITIGEEMKKEGIRLTNFLRQAGLTVEIDYYHHNLKPQFKLSERMKAEYILILGESEWKNNLIKVKNTKTGEEETISIENLLSYFNIKGEPYAYKKQ